MSLKKQRIQNYTLQLSIGSKGKTGVKVEESFCKV